MADDPKPQKTVSLDIGLIPDGFPGAGEYVVTLQVHPFPAEKDAEDVANAVRDAINSKLGVLLLKQNAGH